jgi:hypothetical protein
LGDNLHFYKKSLDQLLHRGIIDRSILVYQYEIT